MNKLRILSFAKYKYLLLILHYNFVGFFIRIQKGGILMIDSSILEEMRD